MQQVALTALDDYLIRAEDDELTDRLAEQGAARFADLLRRRPVEVRDTKTAALLHSLAANHPLVDGNERLAWLAAYVFLAKNGVELDPEDDAAFDLVVAVASGELRDVETIAATLRSFTR